MTIKTYRRAWMIPFGIGFFSLLSSIPPLLFGVDPDPARIEMILGAEMTDVEATQPAVLDLVTFFLRTYGLINLAWSFLIAVVSATALRKGERWAWFALWSLPAYFVGATVILMGVGLTALERVLLPVLFLLSIGALVVARRRPSAPGDDRPKRPRSAAGRRESAAHRVASNKI